MSYNDLRALFLCRTLKKSPEHAHARRLADLRSRIVPRRGVQAGYGNGRLVVGS